jgi:hypothetical protein
VPRLKVLILPLESIFSLTLLTGMLYSSFTVFLGQ